MKTLFLLLISSFAFGATEIPFLSYNSKIDFDLNFNEDYNFHIGENKMELAIDDCVNVWINCSSETIHYSTQVVGPGGTRSSGFVNVSIYSGPTTKCQNDVLLYHGSNLATTGSIPLSALGSVYCSSPDLDYITVYIKYQWGSPSEYCSVYKIFELCD